MVLTSICMVFALSSHTSHRVRTASGSDRIEKFALARDGDQQPILSVRLDPVATARGSDTCVLLNSLLRLQKKPQLRNRRTHRRPSDSQANFRSCHRLHTDEAAIAYAGPGS